MADAKDNPHSDIDDATLARYLGGASDSAELARVERWLAADPAHREELEALRAVWSPPPVPEADEDDRMWRWVSARMERPLPRPVLVREPHRALAASIRRTGLIAAAVALVVGGAFLYTAAGRRDTATRAADAAPMRELITSRGERATGNLPDGSRVILGPDSRLRIPATFAARRASPGDRDVYLEGEAFFEVTHDSTRPFRVHTSQGVAEDLGTEFVVTAYPETKTTRVVVASGVVALRRRLEEPGAPLAPVLLTLTPGDLGRLDFAGTATLRRNVDVAAYVGWTRGELVFDEVPVREAIARLARWYDLDIRLADDAMARLRLTATFHDEPVSRVLRVLEIALRVRAEQDGRLVILRPAAAIPAPKS